MSLNKVLLGGPQSHFNLQSASISTDPAASTLTAPGTNYAGGVNSLVFNAADVKITAARSTFTGVGGASPYSPPTNSGTDNTADGYAALGALTSGTNNTASGASCLALLTTGSNNTGNGKGALASLTTGTHNTSIGAGSLSAVTTQADNTAVGFGAGGALLHATSTFIGSGATGSAARTNSIAVGFGASVLTDNTILLGGTGTTTSVLFSGTDAGTVSLGSAAQPLAQVYSIAQAAGQARTTVLALYADTAATIAAADILGGMASTIPTAGRALTFCTGPQLDTACIAAGLMTAAGLTGLTLPMRIINTSAGANSSTLTQSGAGGTDIRVTGVITAAIAQNTLRDIMIVRGAGASQAAGWIVYGA